MPNRSPALALWG